MAEHPRYYCDRLPEPVANFYTELLLRLVHVAHHSRGNLMQPQASQIAPANIPNYHPGRQ